MSISKKVGTRMFFSDREHRLLLAAIGREQKAIAEYKDLVSLLPELKVIEEKINSLCNAKKYSDLTMEK